MCYVAINNNLFHTSQHTENRNEMKHQIMKCSQDIRLTAESHSRTNIAHLLQEVTVLVCTMLCEFRQNVLVLRPFVLLVRAIWDWKQVWGISLMALTGEIGNYRRKNWPGATLGTINFVSKRTYKEWRGLKVQYVPRSKHTPSSS